MLAMLTNHLWQSTVFALAVALSVRDGAGSFTFDTPVGPVVIETAGEGADP